MGLGHSLSTLLVAALLSAAPVRADEPFARSRDYDLQHSKIILKFDVDQKEIIGDVTHTLSILCHILSRLQPRDSWSTSIGLTHVHAESL